MKEIKKIDIPVMVSRLKNGDQHAFSALYEYFFSKIYFSSKKMFLPHEDAEGVAQEVFLIIWKKKECLDPDLCFHSYLITIMRSLIFKRTKKEARRIAYQKYGIREDFEISTETEDGLVYKEIEQFSINIIEKLPNGQKEVFLLKSYQHLSADEISGKLNISKRTVENQIYKATKSLKVALVKNKLIPPELLLVFLYFLI